MKPFAIGVGIILVIHVVAASTAFYSLWPVPSEVVVDVIRNYAPMRVIGDLWMYAIGFFVAGGFARHAQRSGAAASTPEVP